MTQSICGLAVPSLTVGFDWGLGLWEDGQEPSRTWTVHRLSGGQQEQESAGCLATKPTGRVPFGVTRLPPLRFFCFGMPERYRALEKLPKDTEATLSLSAERPSLMALDSGLSR